MSPEFLWARDWLLPWAEAQSQAPSSHRAAADRTLEIPLLPSPSRNRALVCVPCRPLLLSANVCCCQPVFTSEVSGWAGGQATPWSGQEAGFVTVCGREAPWAGPEDLTTHSFSNILDEDISIQPGTVVHACSLNYSGGGNPEDRGSRPARAHFVGPSLHQ